MNEVANERSARRRSGLASPPGLRDDSRMEERRDILDQLAELLEKFEEEGLACAAIGGLAVNAYGYARATEDLDFLVRGDQADAAANALEDLGYQAIDRREDLSSFARGSERVDLLHANRPTALRLLDEAEPSESQKGLRIISLEGLIGFKIQAFVDDPRRLRDLSDIMELLRRNRGQIDLDEVRGYFRMFEREDLLDDIIERIGS